MGIEVVLPQSRSGKNFMLYSCRIVKIAKVLVNFANVYLATIVTLCSRLKNEKFSVFNSEM